MVGPPASAASAGHPRLVRGTVDAELSPIPIPARRRPYHPTAADMAAVAELVLAALTADHRGTSA